jgi:hypothetical protein
MWLLLFLTNIQWQSQETDQDQMDQNHMQCILNGICNDLVDLDPFVKIAYSMEKFFDNGQNFIV